MQLVYRRVSSAQQVTARQLPDMPYESDANHFEPPRVSWRVFYL